MKFWIEYEDIKCGREYKMINFASDKALVDWVVDNMKDIEILWIGRR